MKIYKTRLFVKDRLKQDQVIDVSSQVHKLLRVLRLRQGDRVALFNGVDGEWLGSLLVFSRQNIKVCVHERMRVQHKSCDIWLVFAPLKRPALSFLVEKATELGVSRLQPVITDHCVIRTIQQKRLYLTAVDAAQQSDRLSIPEFGTCMLLEQLLRHWDHKRSLFVCAEAGQARDMVESFITHQDRLPAILIGPEGGWSDRELALWQTFAFIFPIRFGRRIVRAETAACVALTCWQAFAGPWTKSSS